MGRLHEMGLAAGVPDSPTSSHGQPKTKVDQEIHYCICPTGLGCFTSNFLIILLLLSFPNFHILLFCLGIFPSSAIETPYSVVNLPRVSSRWDNRGDVCVRERES